MKNTEEFSFKEAINLFSKVGEEQGYAYLMKSYSSQNTAGALIYLGLGSSTFSVKSSFGFSYFDENYEELQELFESITRTDQPFYIKNKEARDSFFTNALSNKEKLQWLIIPIKIDGGIKAFILLGNKSKRDSTNYISKDIHAFIAFLYLQEKRAIAFQEEREKEAIKDLTSNSKLVESLQIHKKELLSQYQELQEKQEELILSENYYKYLFEYSPVGYVTINEYGEIIEANNQFKQWFGYKEGRKNNFSRFLNQQDQHAFSDFLLRSFNEKQPTEAEFSVQFEDKSLVFQVVAIALDFDSNDSLVQMSFTNITQIKHLTLQSHKGKIEQLSISLKLQEINLELEKKGEQLENQLKETNKLHTELQRKEKLLNDTGELAKVGGWEVDLVTMIPKWTNETFRIHELPIGAEVTLEDAINFYHPEDREMVESHVNNLIANSERFFFISRIITAKENIKWVQAHGNIESTSNGKRIFGTFQDITERKMKERRLDDLSRLFQLSPDLLSITNLEGHFIELNPAWSEVLGYTLEELKEKPFIYFVHPEDREKTIKEAERLKNPSVTINFINRYRTKGGSYRWFSWMAKSVHEHGGQVYSATRDITNEKKAQAELQKLALVAKKTDNMVIITDHQGRIEWVNHGFTRTTGFSLKEAIGKKPGYLLQGEKTDKEIIEKLSTAIKEGENINVELINYTKQGQEYWVDIDVQPIFNENNELEKFIAIEKVITEKKQQEHRLEQNIELLEKTNKELDNFVYSVSHDLRAPITSALGLIEISRLTDDLPTIFNYLDLQEKSMLKLDRFIQDILDYSRNSRLETAVELIDFETIIQSVFDTVQFSTNKLDREIAIDSDVPFYSDLNRLKVVFSNLVSNGMKYRNPYEQNSFISLTIQTSEENVLIEYRDNGIGISKEHVPHIFEMFYRATQESKGSGLGLYIVKEIISKLKGSIEVESDLGQGVKFRIVLPNRVPKRVLEVN